jgi:hypothetical protein
LLRFDISELFWLDHGGFLELADKEIGEEYGGFFVRVSKSKVRKLNDLGKISGFEGICRISCAPCFLVVAVDWMGKMRIRLGEVFRRGLFKPSAVSLGVLIDRAPKATVQGRAAAKDGPMCLNESISLSLFSPHLPRTGQVCRASGEKIGRIFRFISRQAKTQDVSVSRQAESCRDGIHALESRGKKAYAYMGVC